jgi:hypothetical protein
LIGGSLPVKLRYRLHALFVQRRPGAALENTLRLHEILQSGDNFIAKTRHAEGVDLHDGIFSVFIYNQSRQAIVFRIDEAKSIGGINFLAFWRKEPAPNPVGGFDLALKEGGINDLILPCEHAADDLRVGLQMRAEERAIRGDDIHDGPGCWALRGGSPIPKIQG